MSQLLSFKNIIWKCQPFSELSTLELYKILQLRNEVFVVEQDCPYQDCDGKDLEAYHLSAWNEDYVLAYTRLLPIGISYPDAASIGRVLTSPIARKQELGKILMQKSIEKIQELFGDIPVKIGAQTYLKKFYESFSFFQIGEGYLEDGIPHISMELKRN
ncbi:MAG: GNAT family N-acetyltransferase [Ginsengibacter sp.]|jgi:ElaA protein